jgi:hypothetical protein
VPIELLSSVEDRLRYIPVEPDSRKPERAIRFWERPAKARPSLPVPEDVLELLVANADQTSSRIEIRLDRMLLAILCEKIGQRLFMETIEVLT